MPEKCILNPETDCLGLIKARELEQDFNDFSKRNTESHDRFFNRLEALEKHEGIQGEQYKNIIEKLGDLTTNMNEIKADSKEVISQLPPLTHRVESLEQESKSVNEYIGELREKPAKRWESIVEKVIGLIVAAVVGFFLARMGLN